MARKTTPPMDKFIIQNGAGYVTGITDQGEITTTPDPKRAQVFHKPMLVFWDSLEGYTAIPVETEASEAADDPV